MTRMTNQEDWLQSVTEGASRRQIAAAIGRPQTTFNRQADEGRFDAGTIIAIARHYGANPIIALVETGYLDSDEASSMSMKEVAKLLTDQQLIQELARRIDVNESAWAGTFNEVIEGGSDDEDPKGRRTGSARDPELLTVQSRRRNAADIAERVPRSADAGQRREH